MVDYIVLGIFVMAGFISGAFAQIKQYDFQIRQLEVCLHEIDENTISELTIKRQHYRKRQLFVIFLLALICGILVLAFILART